MKSIKIFLLIVLLITITVGCDLNKKEFNNQKSGQVTTNTDETNKVIETMKIIINNKEYVIKLEDNETVKEFVNILPLNISMDELNSNEKYFYLDTSLTTNPYNPNHIKAGDVMLFGNNCLVVFYKSFDTSYSYTKIGHINDLPDLGNGSISVEIIK